MRYSQYKFSFYLNASHAIYINGELGEAHPHTWEIEIKAIKGQNEFMPFDEVETKIEAFLEPYQNRFINEFEPFDVLNPTLENITSFFLENFSRVLEPCGWIIFYIEVSETPTRSYIISRVENNIVNDLQMKDIVTNIVSHGFSEE